MIVHRIHYKKILFILSSLPAFFLSSQFSSQSNDAFDMMPRDSTAKGKGVAFFSSKENEAMIKDHIASIFHSHRTGLNREREKKLADFIYEECKVNKIDPFLILAIIKTESSFYNWSVGPKGAMGLMQILPSQGKALAKELDLRWEGYRTLFVPEKNVKMGVYYFGKLTRQFKDITLALTAYNWGPTRVLKLLRSGRRPKRKFPKIVLAHYEGFRKEWRIKLAQIEGIRSSSLSKQQKSR